MISKVDRNKSRQVRHTRVRRKVSGTKNIPRLNVYRSNKNMYVQIIDDTNGNTLLSASSLDDKVKGKNKVESASSLGKLIAKLANKENINNVVFDRGGYLYHGRIKALADAAREEGLKF